MNNRFAPLLLVPALVVVVLGTVFLYAHGQPDVYTSRAVLSLSPRDPATVGGDNLQLAAARYTAYLASASTMEDVAAQIGESAQQVVDFTEVRVQPNTVNIEVVVTMRDQVRAATIVNALAAAGLAEGRVDPLVTVDLMVPGVVAKVPSGPNRRLILIGGFGVALMLGILAIAALGYLQNSATLTWSSPQRVPQLH
jgi:capsular polysaccharide biosynthesis protein